MKNCPKEGFETGEPDRPVYWKAGGKERGEAEERTLEFRIILYSGKGCDKCKEKAVAYKGKQIVGPKTVTWNTNDADDFDPVKDPPNKGNKK